MSKDDGGDNMEMIIPSIATIISTAIAGWFALQQSRQKRDRELQVQIEHLERIVERRSDEMLKCIALNMMHPNAHLCDMQDALIKWEEANSEYETFLEKVKLELIK